MNVIKAIIQNWDIITLVIAVLTVIAIFAFKGNKGIIMRILYAAVTQAEKEFGAGTGALKLATVIEWVYPKLPAFIKLFVTAQTLTKWIEIVLAEAKRTWENNSSVAAYIDKPPDELQEPAQELEAPHGE